VSEFQMGGSTRVNVGNEASFKATNEDEPTWPEGWDHDLGGVSKGRTW